MIAYPLPGAPKICTGGSWSEGRRARVQQGRAARRQRIRQAQIITAGRGSVRQGVPNGCPGGSPQWINGLHGKNALWAYGGLITRGPLQGTQFGANGVPSQFDYGYGYNGQPALPARLGDAPLSRSVNASNPAKIRCIVGIVKIIVSEWY